MYRVLLEIQEDRAISEHESAGRRQVNQGVVLTTGTTARYSGTRDFLLA